MTLRWRRGYDREQAHKFRCDRNSSVMHRRVSAGITIGEIAGELGMMPMQFARLQDGEMWTDEAGWDEVDSALEALKGRR